MPEPGLDSCVFCNIAAGTVPGHIVYQDRDFVAFLDNVPLFPGHVLLSPREHYVTLHELPSELAGPAMLVTKLLARAVESAVECRRNVYRRQ